MERETAGDPISGLKWTRKTTEKIARQLKRLGITVSRNTVGRLLRQMKFSLRTFKNPGAKWERTSTAVNDHDFRSAAKGIGIPYGIYDTQANRGSVFLGTSHETSAFAVSCLRKWWLQEGRKRYPQSSHILILADSR